MLTVRPADPSEHETLTALVHRAKAHWGYPERMLALWDGLTLTGEFIVNNDVVCAVDNARVIGVGALCPTESGFELEHLWVEPDHQRQGVGRLLLTVLVKRARAHGATRLTIVSDPNAEAFYERMGARRTGMVESTPPGRLLPVLELVIPV